jgi:quercetin dioxygenase-like cupin family protein
MRWDWPDELDALVAAPAHHTLLLENERVRVLETRIPAGETTAVHTHRWPNVQYVMSSPDLVRRDGEGIVLLDTRSAERRNQAPVTHWSEPLPPHSIENVGETDLRVIMVELKD